MNYLKRKVLYFPLQTKRKSFKLVAITTIVMAVYIILHFIPEQDNFNVQFLTLFPPDKMDTVNQPLVFLHIGKCGGTSFDNVMRRAAKDINRRYVGYKHFDWSYIERVFGTNVNVLTILRHPVDRAISHFNFAKRLPWTKGMKIRDQTISEYLNDAKSMHETRTVWCDGQAGVMWLTGTHVDNWVQIPESLIESREKVFAQTKYIAQLTIERLLNTTWFGILEDLDRSMKMLSTSLGRGVAMAKLNHNKHKDNAENEDVRKKLAELMPFDIWLYEYALKVFEARWKYHSGDKNVKVPVPPDLPEMKCRSTVKYFVCENAEMMGSFKYNKSS